jgi:hypothetical protein
MKQSHYQDGIQMPRIYTLILLSIILLTSCSSPATALPTEVPTNTPQPTITPIPTNTNTPTPTLEPWMVSLPEGVVSVQIENDAIFGLDSQGKQIMQFSVEDSKWVVVKPKVVMNSSKYEYFEQKKQEWLDQNPWALEEIDWEIFVTDTMKDADGNPLGYGVLSEWRSEDGKYYMVDVGVVCLGGFEYREQIDGTKVYVGVFGVPLEDGGTALIFAGRISGNKPAINVFLYRDGVWHGRSSSIGLTEDQLMNVVLSPNIKGKQVVIKMMVYVVGFPEYDVPNEEYIKYLKGEGSEELNGPQDFSIDGFEAPEDWGLALAGLR